MSQDPILSRITDRRRFLASAAGALATTAWATARAQQAPAGATTPRSYGPDAEPVRYPESDGRPMADNTKQARWIVVLFGNLSALFRAVADVFVAADLLWYPRQGEPGDWRPS